MGKSNINSDEARTTLYDVMRAERPLDEKITQALELGKEYLGVDNAHLTKIDPEAELWRSVASTDDEDGQFPAGMTLELGQTYCRRAITEGTVTLHAASEQGWTDDPTYREHEIDCYHGTAMTVDGELHGTLCFVSVAPREKPFTAEETMFAELIARLLEREIQQDRMANRLAQLDQFASTVSHDLRNPLNVAQLRLDIERRIRDSKHLTVAARSLDRMEELISDVLSLARQAQTVTETEQLSLRTIATRSWDVVRTDDASLAVAGDYEFQGDRRRAQQLFENLFRNAVEHGSTGNRSETDDSVEHAGGDVSVTVGPLPSGDGFYIEDDGPGIPAEKRDRIFDAGYTTGEDGIGLGLAIVSGVVVAHDWEITVTESESGGARFEVTSVLGEIVERTQNWND